MEEFFRTPNLMALRELALRRVADRVEAAARALPVDRTRSRLAGDRVLVAVGPDEQAEQLVRAGKRMADALDAEWTVVYVETPALLRLSDAERNRRIDVLRLAESLGAETVTLDGPTAAAALLEYASTRNATRVIVGAPKRARLARVAAALDHRRNSAPRAWLRCHRDRAAPIRRGAQPARRAQLAARHGCAARARSAGTATAGRS